MTTEPHAAKLERPLKNDNNYLLFKALETATLDVASNLLKFQTVLSLNDRQLNGIFVRECYKKLVEFIDRAKTQKFLLLGDAGMGKTHFSYYFLHYLIGQGQSFIYESANNKMIYFFDSSNRQLYTSSCAAEVEKLLNDARFWYIVDGQRPSCSINVAAKILLISSYQKENYHFYATFHLVNCYHMSCWSLKELIDCKRLCFGNLNDELVDSLYKKFGSTPRYVLDKANVESIHSELKKSIESFKLNDLLTYQHESVSGGVLNFDIDELTLQDKELVFTSEYVLRRVVEKYYVYAEDLLKKIIKTSLSSAHLQKVGRQLLRFYSFLKLATGGSFCFKDVDTGFESKLELPGREFQYFSRIDEIFETKGYSKYLWKRVNCEPLLCLDLFLAPNYVFVFESPDFEFNLLTQDDFREELVALIESSPRFSFKKSSEFTFNLTRIVSREVYYSKRGCPRHRQYYFDVRKPSGGDDDDDDVTTCDRVYECRVFVNELMCLVEI